jgi:hypothetical protein
MPKWLKKVSAIVGVWILKRVQDNEQNQTPDQIPTPPEVIN